MKEKNKITVVGLIQIALLLLLVYNNLRSTSLFGVNPAMLDMGIYLLLLISLIALTCLKCRKITRHVSSIYLFITCILFLPSTGRNLELVVSEKIANIFQTIMLIVILTYLIVPFFGKDHSKKSDLG